MRAIAKPERAHARADARPRECSRVALGWRNGHRVRGFAPRWCNRSRARHPRADRGCLQCIEALAAANQPESMQSEMLVRRVVFDLELPGFVDTGGRRNALDA